MKAPLLIVFTITWLASVARAGDPLDQWHRVDTTGPRPGSSIRYGQGKWLGLGWTGSPEAQYLHASTDGRSWAIIRTFDQGEQPVDLAFAAGLWVLTGIYQYTNLFVLTSSNGETWTPATIPPIASYGHWPKVQRHKNEWIITSTTTGSLRSNDGQTWNWSSNASPPSDSFYLDGYWIVQRGYGVPGFFSSLMASTNLTEWHSWRPWPFSNWEMFYTLKFAKGLWFGVVGPSTTFGMSEEPTTIVTSTDGTNWINRYLGRGITDVEIINGRLVATSTYFSGIDGWQIGDILESDSLIALQQNKPGDLRVHRASGIPVVVESSDDLSQWHTMTNLPYGESIEAVTDPAPIVSKRFYRARTP